VKMTTLQKIADIETEMARTQKNKATMSHLCILKAKLAKLRRELLAPAGKAGEGFDVTKSGDARVGMIGFPSVGKSTLLTKLTGTKSEIAAWEFTTLTCIPGSFSYKGAKIQLLDLPGIIQGAKDGKGRGKQVIGVARTCDLILIVLDATRPLIQKRIIEKELEGFGIRLNKKPPEIAYKQRDKGGIVVGLSGIKELTYLDKSLIQGICKEYRVTNAEFTFKVDATVDDLIDVIEGNRVYIPCLYVLNKIDAITIEELDLLSRVPHYVPVSADQEWNFDDLSEKMWDYLGMMRIYPKPKGEMPDYESPVIVPRVKNTIEDFCTRIHRGLTERLKYALVWGSSVKHNPQKVGKEHLLNDEDVVQIIKKV
jgi:uncharacterized protein